MSLSHIFTVKVCNLKIFASLPSFFCPEAHRSQLELDLHAMERREQELKAAKQNLEEQLDSVIRQSQEALADTQVELNKYKLHSETLEKKQEVECSVTVLMNDIWL